MYRSKYSLVSAGALACALGTISIPSSAAVINIDFNEVGISPGTSWNVLASPVDTALADSTGAATPYAIDFTSGSWIGSSGTAGQEGAFDGTAFDNAADDFFVVGGTSNPKGTETFTLTGFEATDTVVIKIIGSSDTTLAGRRLGDYQINGSFADTTPDGDGYNANADGFVNGSVLQWTVTGSTSYDFSLTDTGVSGTTTAAILSAAIVEVTPIPEPGSMALLALGSALMLTRRRQAD